MVGVVVGGRGDADAVVVVVVVRHTGACLPCCNELCACSYMHHANLCGTASKQIPLAVPITTCARAAAVAGAAAAVAAAGNNCVAPPLSHTCCPLNLEACTVWACDTARAVAVRTLVLQ